MTARPASRFPVLLVAALAVLATLPVLLAPVATMTDLPGHIARFRIFAAAGTASPLAALYDVHWRWIGNLGVDLPVVALTRLVGVEAASRIVVGTIAPLTIVGIAALSRATHGRVTAAAFVAMPLALSHAWAYGFVNYCLGLALGLPVAAAWIARPPRGVAAALGFGIAAVVVWTAHLGAWIVLLLIVAGAELATLRHWRALPGRIAAAAPLLLPAVPLLGWRSGGATAVLYSYGRFPLASKLMAFVTMLDSVGRTFDIASALILVALGGVALWMARRPRIDARLGIAASLVALVVAAVPASIMESWGTDLRMAPVAVLLALLAIRPAADPRRERSWLCAGIALFAVRIAALTAHWQAEDRRIAPSLALLDAVPAGARLGYVYAEQGCRVAWPVGPDDKLGSYAIVRRDAFTNATFHTVGSDLAAPRDPHDAAAWRMDSTLVHAICPAGVADAAAVRARLAAMAADRFDMLWLHGATAGIAPPPGFVTLRARAGDTLFARAAAKPR